jgi:formylmethanofuran dehydrogenase subunit E
MKSPRLHSNRTAGLCALVFFASFTAFAQKNTIEAQLDQVAAVHGGAGPFAVAGFRMAQHALKVLQLEPGSFDLEVEHHSPKAVQFSCIADGAQAATKVSVGKLSLRWVEAPQEATETIYLKRSTGQKIVLRPTASFIKAFANLPHDKARENGRKVLALRDEQIFEVR